MWSFSSTRYPTLAFQFSGMALEVGDLFFRDLDYLSPVCKEKDWQRGDPHDGTQCLGQGYGAPLSAFRSSWIETHGFGDQVQAHPSCRIWGCLLIRSDIPATCRMELERVASFATASCSIASSTAQETREREKAFHQGRQ